VVYAAEDFIKIKCKPALRRIRKKQIKLPASGRIKLKNLF
jgi:hypothetical protein